ncbi:hypothetical protein FIBSPDRAFT_900057 [Athelia psychrophila]|uniref:Uncharacterized protein n=1 Tax=Athelia psychrophila TaxID=1759441 RepID=A0A165YX07_9AGAM|nr:hypothetical protein FIBSPDRAFT_900057 [Fibularhizoctonia sp. CBS 109695]
MQIISFQKWVTRRNETRTQRIRRLAKEKLVRARKRITGMLTAQLTFDYQDIVEIRRLHGKDGRRQGDGMGDVECLVFIFDLQLRFNDRNGQGQSYGFGVATTMLATMVVAGKPKPSTTTEIGVRLPP